MKIEIDVRQINDLVAKMRKVNDGSLQKKVDGLLRETAQTMAREMRERAGQVLNVRTGRLQKSIVVREVKGQNGTQYLVGTRLKYGSVHEYGFTGSVNIPAHERRRAKGSSPSTRRKGHPKPSKTYTVRAHKRNMRLPARPFIRPVFQQNLPGLVKDLQALLKDHITSAL